MFIVVNKEILFIIINFCYILYSLMRLNYMFENLILIKIFVNEREYIWFLSYNYG